MNMRSIINLIEAFETDEEVDFQSLPSSAHIKALRPAIIAAAQSVYNKWQPEDDDDIGFQDEYGGGGICHFIAECIVSILSEAGFPCTTVSSNHEVHVYTVAQCSDGVFEVDIPYRTYETGGGYTWKRIEGVVFEETDVSIQLLDHDPASFNNYIDY